MQSSYHVSFILNSEFEHLKDILLSYYGFQFFPCWTTLNSNPRLSTAQRLLGAHTSEGGGTSAAPPDAAEEDFGNSPAIPSGGGWIGSVGAWGGRLAARRRRGNSKKAEARRPGNG